jgi:16S rRNA (adenine1518-N6/adenine1519-N6)-dimethyltransferase
VRQALNVPPSAFYPPPDVQSVVVQIKRHAESPLPAVKPQVLAKLLWAAFGQRRKTLLNSLTGSYLGGDKTLWQQALLASAINPSHRAEQLNLADFGRLLQQPPVIELLQGK